jgi:hypothetical protein
MTATVQEDLRQFTTALLEATGGIIEWSGSEGTAMVPPPLAKALRVPADSLVLSPQPTRQGLHVSLGGEFLDLAGQVLAAAVPRVASFRIAERYLKKAEMGEAVARTFSWPNARVRVLGAGAASVEYQTWHFHASIRSEDVFETLLSLTLNARSLAAVELADLLEEPDVAPAPALGGDPSALLVQAGRLATRKLLAAGGSFLARMDARLARDQKRLKDYYSALLKEAGAVNRRTKNAPTPEATAAKREAVQLELRRKQAEVRERYAMSATLTPIALVRCQLPALAVQLDVTRKQSRCERVLYWNPLLKALEPMACEHCGSGIFCVYFTEEDVAPLCRACWERT